jgi:hypothetical protein
MRKTQVVRAVVAAGLLACAVGAQAQEPGRAAKAIRWAPSFKAAMDTAKASGKLVMADFYTEW